MRKLSFDQIVGKTIARAELQQSSATELESDTFELTFTDGSSFGFDIAPAPPKISQFLTQNEKEDFDPKLIERDGL
jgi:hypothetical protein